MIQIIIILEVFQMILIVFIFHRLRVIEVTKEVQIVSNPKREKQFDPVVVKPKTGVGNHIINAMKNANKRSNIER